MISPLLIAIEHGNPAVVETMLRLRPDLVVDKGAFNMCFTVLDPEIW